MYSECTPYNLFCALRDQHAARWPLPMCRRIAAGCEEVIREHHIQRQFRVKNLPAVKKRVRFNDAVSLTYVEGRGTTQSVAFPLLTHTANAQHAAFPARVPAVAIACPACRRNQAAEAPGHNRIEGDCRFPHVQTRDYPCPGCRARAARDSDMHTLVPGECRVHEMRTRGVGGREGRQPRGAAAPASSDPSGSSAMRPAAASPDDPEEVDPLPEAVPPSRRASRSWDRPVSAPPPPPGATGAPRPPHPHPISWPQPCPPPCHRQPTPQPCAPTFRCPACRNY